MPTSEPFDAWLDVPVVGGALRVGRAGPPSGEARGVVLAAHGVTASLMTWRSVARLLPDDICFLAPDLRGRGRSSGIAGPYGIGVHVEDLIAVLDHEDVASAVLVGHSMGAYVVARLAADHPERAIGLVLLDAGLPLPQLDRPDRTLESALANAVMRLSITFPSADRYIEGWRAHPAFAKSWDEDIEIYARYDLVENETSARCVASPAAVRADTSEMVLDAATRGALDGVQRPVQVLRAGRGLFDDEDNPMISARALRKYAAAHPTAVVEDLTDVNHYTLVMGDGPGPRRVAAAIERAFQE